MGHHDRVRYIAPRRSATLDQDQKERVCRLVAQLVIAKQLSERESHGGPGRPLSMAISAAVGNATSLAHSLSVTDDEIQAAADAIRSHKAYQFEGGS